MFGGEFNCRPDLSTSDGEDSFSLPRLISRLLAETRILVSSRKVVALQYLLILLLAIRSSSEVVFIIKGIVMLIQAKHAKVHISDTSEISK